MTAHDEARAAIATTFPVDGSVASDLALAVHPWNDDIPFDLIASELRVPNSVPNMRPQAVAIDRLLRIEESLQHAQLNDAATRYGDAARRLIDATADSPQEPALTDPSDPLAGLDTSLIWDLWSGDDGGFSPVIPEKRPSFKLARSPLDSPSSQDREAALDAGKALLAARARHSTDDLGLVLGTGPSGLSTTRTAQFLGAETVADRLEGCLAGFDERERYILRHRVFMDSKSRTTLEDVGLHWSLTRERIRQIEKRLVVKLDGNKSVVSIRDEITELMSQGGLPVARAAAIKHRALVLADGDKPTAACIREIAGPWSGDDVFVWPSSADTRIEDAASRLLAQADADGVVPGHAIIAFVESDVVAELDTEAFLLTRKVQRVGDVWVVSDRVENRIAAALRSIGCPATRDEISDLLPGDARRYVSNTLSTMAAVVRADKDRFWFANEVEDVYDGIAGEIEQRIDQNGGSVSLASLIRELPTRFGVSESSVRSYAVSNAFDVSRGMVTRKNPDAFIGRDPASIPGAAYIDGRWGQTIQLTKDQVERGYSFMVSAHLAYANRVRIGDRLDVPLTVHGPNDDGDQLSADGATASVIWRAAAVGGKIDVGRTATAMRNSGLRVDDTVVVVAGPEGVCIYLQDTGAEAVGRPEAPPCVIVDLGSHEITLPVLTARSGNAWFATANNGRYIRSGVRVQAGRTDALPDQAKIEQTQLTFGPLPLYDKEARRDVDGEFEDFDRTRLAEGAVQVNGRQYAARIRVTRRTDGSWNVTAQVFPTQDSEALTAPAQSAPAHSVPQRTSPVEAGTDRLSRLAEGPSF